MVLFCGIIWFCSVVSYDVVLWHGKVANFVGFSSHVSCVTNNDFVMLWCGVYISSFKIAEVDSVKERFLVTLKPSDLKMCSRLSQKEVYEDSLVQFERLLGERDQLLRDQGRPLD